MKDGVEAWSEFHESPASQQYHFSTDGIVKSATSENGIFYVITSKDRIIAFDPKTKKQIGHWRSPNYGSCHGQLVAKNDLIYLVDPKNNALLIYDTNGNQKSQKLELKGIQWPTFLAVPNRSSVIISGSDRVGKFSSKQSGALPHWIKDIKGAAGICVDGKGRLFVGVNKKRTVFVLGAETGKQD